MQIVHSHAAERLQNPLIQVQRPVYVVGRARATRGILVGTTIASQRRTFFRLGNSSCSLLHCEVNEINDQRSKS